MSSLPIMPVVRASFARVGASPRQTLQVAFPYYLVLLMIAMVGLLFAPRDPNQMSAAVVALSIVLLVAQILVLTVMAVAWHRVTLLGFSADGGVFRIGFGRRELKFLGYSLLVYPLGFAIGLIYGLASAVSPFVGLIVLLSMVALGAVLFLRCSLVLPATSVDHPTSLKQSWQQTAGAFWQMLAIHFVSVALLLIPVFLVSLVVGLVLADLGVVGAFLIQVVFVALQIGITFVAISALSYIYRHLSNHPDPLGVAD